mmetsp:Transcript_84852/g.227505  ORF Transcript_84852/g.227505 Transcript_84852/m.227505 type:complete len:211 (-) Transcript_84852:4-636(-)
MLQAFRSDVVIFGPTLCCVLPQRRTHQTRHDGHLGHRFGASANTISDLVALRQPRSASSPSRQRTARLRRNSGPDWGNGAPAPLLRLRHRLALRAPLRSSGTPPRSCWPAAGATRASPGQRTAAPGKPPARCQIAWSATGVARARPLEQPDLQQPAFLRSGPPPWQREGGDWARLPQRRASRRGLPAATPRRRRFPCDGACHSLSPPSGW